MSFLSLRALAVIGGVYDLALAVPMIFAPELTARLFGAPAPVPVVRLPGEAKTLVQASSMGIR